MAISGVVECVSRESISGWVIDKDRPDRQLVVELMINDRHIAAAVAVFGHSDIIQMAELGGGVCAFEIHPPDGVPLDQSKLAVRVVGSDVTLHLADGAFGLEGYIDFRDDTRIGGWAWQVGSPAHRVELILRQGGTQLRRFFADQFRSDLLDAGIGEGLHSFLVEPGKAGASPGLSAADIDVVFARTGQPLTNISLDQRGEANPRNCNASGKASR